jgi:hypothetical protein
VPYLGRGKQGEVLKEYIETHYAIAKADLATVFVMRCLQLCVAGGSTALVTPQNWLFLTSYKKLREELLKRRQWNLVARLGPKGFQTPMWDFNIQLGIISAVKPADDHRMGGLDVAEAKTPTDKAERLADSVPTPVQVVEQAGQLKNPDAVVAVEQLASIARLSSYAQAFQGTGLGDIEQYRMSFWEISSFQRRWDLHVSSPVHGSDYSGMHFICKRRFENGAPDESPLISVRGRQAWGKKGVAIAWLGTLPASIYLGSMYDNSATCIIPFNQSHLLPVYAFCKSEHFNIDVRKINQKMQVANATMVQVPFDLAHWQAVAAEKYPNGLPEPHSDDPTQWLFKGDIATSTDPLQVAIARLLGYRWPDQPKEDAVVDPFVDDDGIVCLPGVRHEAPAAERLADLLRAVGYKTEADLATWLRDKFFEEHCKRFHQRPFIWHIWDGRKDGFAALVNYHKLTHKTLENLTYSYLGDWISAQSKSDKTGADLRLAAAQALQEKLKLILAGEPPYDIFVRWKPLHEQAICWHPDLNDGVRMNIRPFVEADILRKTPNIKWTKDRGKEPERDKHDYPWFWSGGEFVGDRVNDVHLTNEKKTAARSRKKGAK